MRAQCSGPTFVLEAGDLAFSPDQDLSTRLRRVPVARALAEGARVLDYDALATGEQDLEPPPSQWAAGLSLPWVTGDSAVRVIAKDGLRVGVVALTGDLSTTPRQMRSRADLVVLLSHVPLRRIPLEILQEADVLVNVHLDDLPEQLPNHLAMVFMPESGRSLGVFRVPLRSGQGRARVDHAGILADLVPIDATDQVDPALVSIAEKGLKATRRPEPLRPEPPPGYIGASACRPCHEPQSLQWSGTPHARSLSTLERRSQDEFPECLRCHVTALGGPPDPTFLPDVQCEACHGPGAGHARSPQAFPMIKKPATSTCLVCHDSQFDDGRFDADTYLPRVAH